MDPSTVRALIPTASTVLVLAVGAAATRALHVGVPGGFVVACALVLLGAFGVAAGAAVRHRATRRRDDLDAEWAAVEPRWRARETAGGPDPCRRTRRRRHRRTP